MSYQMLVPDYLGPTDGDVALLCIPHGSVLSCLGDTSTTLTVLLSKHVFKYDAGRRLVASSMHPRAHRMVTALQCLP